MVSFRLVPSNPTLPEITDGYEVQLHHSLGHDLGRFFDVSCASHLAGLLGVSHRNIAISLTGLCSPTKQAEGPFWGWRRPLDGSIGIANRERGVRFTGRYGFLKIIDRLLGFGGRSRMLNCPECQGQV